MQMKSVEPKSEIALKAMVLLTMAALLAGCGGGTSNSGGTNTGGSSGGGTAALSPASSFYIVEQYLPPEPSKILQFSRTANGSVAPASTITVPPGAGFTALAVDGLGNLYVGGQEFSGSTEIGPEIWVYAPGAIGTPTPSQTITASLQSPSANSISAMAVDNAQNLYAVTAVALGSGPTGRVYTGIAVYAPAANGKLAPIKSIVGPATEISNNPDQIATDSAGNLYVASGSTATGPGSVVIFSSSATGNMPPTSALTGPNTTIGYAQGVALDSAGNIYVSSAAQLPQSVEDGAPSILKFSAGSTGNVAPILTISGSATAMDNNIGNLRVDSAGNIYVVSGSAILRFAPGATGNVAPAATISSSAFFGTGGPIAVQ
jgi:sugar lactone lactonase YvrE